MSKTSAAATSALRSDGLVPVASALGLHADADRRLAFSTDHQWVGREMNHLDLLSIAEVGAKLVDWLEAR